MIKFSSLSPCLISTPQFKLGGLVDAIAIRQLQSATPVELARLARSQLSPSLVIVF